MFHELVGYTVDGDTIALHLVARLREGERAVLFRLSELRTAFCQSFEKTLVGIIDATTHVLTDLRVQITPRSEAAQNQALQNVCVHVVTRDVFSGQAVVAPLQGNEVIPDSRGDKQLVPQLAIFFVAAV
jgi:hypothetical protein